MKQNSDEVKQQEVNQNTKSKEQEKSEINTTKRSGGDFGHVENDKELGLPNEAEHNLRKLTLTES